MLLLACFLFPVGVYCLALGLVNRRAHPLLVRGSWDCLGLLLGLSGMLLIGGPAALASLYDREVRAFLLGFKKGLAFEDLFAAWWRVWLAYYLGVLGGAAVLIGWRARATVVYNVEPPAFDDLLARVLDGMGTGWTRLGNRVVVGFRNGANGAEPPAGRPDAEAVLDVEPSYTTRHVTLVWRGAAGRVRPEVEAELARGLAAVWTRENPAGNWLLAAAALLFTLVFLALVGTILLGLRSNRFP